VISGPHRYPLRAADLAVADNCLRPAALGLPTFPAASWRGAPDCGQNLVRLVDNGALAEQLHYPSFTVQPGSTDALHKALERDGTTIIEPPNNAREDALLTRDPASTPVQLLDTEQATPRLVRPKCHR
jgi:hypothetical protein